MGSNEPGRTFLQQLSVVTIISSVLFVIYYTLFALFYPAVHGSNQPVDINNIIFWQQEFISQDGNELQVMFFGSIAYLLAAYALQKLLIRVKFIADLLIAPFWLTVLFLLLFFIRIRSETFSLLPGFIGNAGIILLLPLLILVCFKIYSISRSSGIFSLIIFFILWIILAGAIFFVSGTPNLIDYSFFMGPALKISQGEPFDSFYMQYGLAETMLFKWMMDLGMRLSQMQVILSLVLVSWFFLYYLLLKNIIKEKFLIFLFMFSLLITRHLAILHDAISYPQTLPIRLDLWVPLTLVIYKYGFLSPISSTVVALIYLLDSNFGLFYLSLYSVFLTVSLLQLPKANIGHKWNNLVKNLSVLLTPILLSLSIHYLLMGSPISIGSMFYQNLRLGFLPISLTSPFWVALAFLPYAIFVFANEKRKDRKIFYFFLIGLSLVQLIYFFGRSHDQNLLNISGIFLVIFFVVLDKLRHSYQAKNIALPLATLFLTLILLLFAGKISIKLTDAAARLANGTFTTTTSQELFADNNPNLLADYKDSEKLVILNQFDSYFNYRYGVKQAGFWAPFYIHVYTDETVDYIKDLLDKDYKVVLWEDEITELIEQFNQSQRAQNTGIQFDFVDKGNIYELVILKTGHTKTRSGKNQWTNASLGTLLTFQHPKTWRVIEYSQKEKITIEDPQKQFFIDIEPEQEFSNDQLERSFRPVFIPGTGKVFVQPIKINNTYKTVFYLPREQGIIRTTVWPPDSPLMRRFYSILSTMKLSD